MDTIFTGLINAGTGAGHARWRRWGIEACHGHIPVRGGAKSRASRAAGPPLRDHGEHRRDVQLELDDIQGSAPRAPAPMSARTCCFGSTSATPGRTGPASPPLVVWPVAHDPSAQAWITVAFTYYGLKALGVAPASLDSFAAEFRQGMAARAAELGDVGDSAPSTGNRRSERPTCTWRWQCSRPTPSGSRLAERARRAQEQLPGVELIWRQDCYQLPTGRTSFGFKDGIGQPAIEGSGIPPTNPQEHRSSRRVHPRLPGRDRRRCRRCRRRPCSAGTARTSCFANFTPGSRLPPVPP